jgi:hypothetical protein
MKPVLKQTSDAEPHSVVMAATDDVFMIGTVSEQIRSFALIKELLEDELDVQTAKCVLLVPENKLHLVGRRDFPNDLKVVSDGMKVVGTPVGTDEYVRSQSEIIANKALKKLKSLEMLQSKPQLAMRLMTRSIVPALSHLSQTVPPHLLLETTKKFDNGIQDMRKLLLETSTGSVPKVGKILQKLADRKASLSLKQGGLGQISAELVSFASYYASYAQYVFLEKVPKGKVNTANLQHCINFFKEEGVSVAYEIKDFGSKQPPRGLQRTIVRQLHTQRKERLVQKYKALKLHEDAFALKHANTAGAWRVFATSPHRREFTMKQEEFVAYTRSHLGLPQMLRTLAPAMVVPASDPDDPVPDRKLQLGYQADPCRRCLNKVCDRHLIHAQSCPTTAAMAQHRHEKVKHATANMLTEAGMAEVIVEPPLKLQARRQARQENKSRRRADITAVDVSDPQRHRKTWLDITIGHSFAPSHNFTANNEDPLRTINNLVKFKSGIYAEFQKELVNFRLAANYEVEYHTSAYSSLGRVSEGAHSDVSIAARSYTALLKRELRQGPRLDGKSVQQLRAEFIYHHETAIQFAIARGNSHFAIGVGL